MSNDVWARLDATLVTRTIPALDDAGAKKWAEELAAMVPVSATNARRVKEILNLIALDVLPLSGRVAGAVATLSLAFSYALADNELAAEAIVDRLVSK